MFSDPVGDKNTYLMSWNKESVELMKKMIISPQNKTVSYFLKMYKQYTLFITSYNRQLSTDIKLKNKN